MSTSPTSFLLICFLSSLSRFDEFKTECTFSISIITSLVPNFSLTSFPSFNGFFPIQKIFALNLVPTSASSPTLQASSPLFMYICSFSVNPVDSPAKDLFLPSTLNSSIVSIVELFSDGKNIILSPTLIAPDSIRPAITRLLSPVFVNL